MLRCLGWLVGRSVSLLK